MSSDIAASPPRLGPSALLRRSRGPLALLVTLAGLAGGAFWAKTAWLGEAATAAAPRPAGARGPMVSVDSALIGKGDFPLALNGLGTVTASATSIVKTQISGQLQEINFHEGQLVKAGDVLAQVDPRPYRLILLQTEGQLRKDASLLQNAERDLQRYETLRQRMKDAVSEQQLDTQRALIDQYKGTVAVDTAQVEQAGLNLDYSRIVSLIDGRVGLRQVDQGNFVQANDPNGIAVVTRLSPITVIFTLPESSLPLVLRRLHSGKDLTVIAYDNDRSKELARGQLSAVDNQIDASTGTVKLRAIFANEDERLYPNQFVNAELLVDTLRDVVLVPAAAIQRGAKGPYVYAIKSDNSVAATPVKLGPGNGESIVVEQGLTSGERVVIEGADRLREGSLVTLAGAKPAAGEKRKANGAS